MQRTCKISGSDEAPRENDALEFSRSNKWPNGSASEVQFWDTQSLHSEGIAEPSDVTSTIISAVDLVSQSLSSASSGHKFSSSNLLCFSRGMHNVPKELKFGDETDSAYGSCCPNDLERTPSPTPTSSTQCFEDSTADPSHSVRDELDSAALQRSPCTAVTGFSVDSYSNPGPASTIGTVSDTPYHLRPPDIGCESPDESQRQFSGSSDNNHIYSGGGLSIGAKRAAPTGGAEDDDNGPAEPKRAHSAVILTRFGRQLACLYSKRVGARHTTNHSCFMRGFTNILKLKEHLFRFHALSALQCSNCYQHFSNEAELEQHESVPCSVRARVLPARFNREQQEKLVNVSKWNTTQEEVWNAMWRILFPDNEEIPSPYFRVSKNCFSPTLSTFELGNDSFGFGPDDQCMDSASIPPGESNILQTSENSSPDSQHYEPLSGTFIPDTKAERYDGTSDQLPQELCGGISTVHNSPAEVMLGHTNRNDCGASPLQQCQAHLSSILPVVESPELYDLVGAHMTSKNREVFARVMVSLRRILNLDNSSSQGEDDDISLEDDFSQSTRSGSISFGSSSLSRNSCVSHPSHEGSVQHDSRPHGTSRHTSTKVQQRSSINPRKRTIPPEDSDEEANEENNKMPRSGTRQHGTGYGRRFACPFRKMFPSLQPVATSCIHPGFTDTARMKEHLYRKHSLPKPYCEFCYEVFPNRQMLSIHLWPPQGSSQCSRSGRKPDMFLSGEQETQLRQRSRRGIAEYEKWRNIYLTLFQSEGETLTNIPSPYIDEHSFATAIGQRDTANRSPDIGGVDLRCRTTLYNDIGAWLQAEMNTRTPIDVERYISEILGGIDPRRRQLFSAGPSAVPGLYTETPLGDNHDGSTLTEAYAPSFPELPPFQPYQGLFYRPEPEADPNNLPSLFSISTNQSQERAMGVSGQFLNSALNAFHGNFTPLDRTMRLDSIWQQPYAPGGWNSGISQDGGQQSWNTGLVASAPVQQNYTPALTNPIQDPDVPFPNNQASTDNLSQPLSMRQDNEHALGVLQEPNCAGLDEEPPSRRTNAVNYEVAYSSQYPTYPAQNLTFNEGSALSTAGAEMQEDQTWSHNPHDADWGSTLATTPNSYPIQNDIAENSQGEYCGLDVPSPD